MAGRTAETQMAAKVASVLDAVAAHAEHGLRIGELADACALSPAAANRLMAGLTKAGLLARNPVTSRYQVGGGLLDIAIASMPRFDLQDSLRPHLEEIARETDDTAYLSIRTGFEALCIGRAEGGFPVKTLALRVGGLRPLGVGAGSLALLAFLEEPALTRTIRASAARRQSFGIDETQLPALVREARRQGHTFLRGVVVPGMNAVGLPLFSREGEPYAALSVSCIAERMSEARAVEIVDLLRAHRDAFEAAHGGPLPLSVVTMIQHRHADAVLR